MSISQSVEAPLTVADTATLSGSLSAQNGNGNGTLGCSLRHVTSTQGWVEVRYTISREAFLGDW